MATGNSVETMSSGLRAALSDKDWQSAHRHIERLNSIVLDALVRNDPGSIQSAGSALQSCGQHLELGNKLPMELNELALAWQLRANAAMAVLAQRIRPIAPLSIDIGEDVSDLLLKFLRESNYPMSNAQVAERTGKDPATVSRTLKRLKTAGKVKQWRAGRKVYNAARSSWRQFATEQDNPDLGALRTKSVLQCEPRNVAPREGVGDLAGLRNPNKDAVEYDFSKVPA